MKLDTAEKTSKIQGEIRVIYPDGKDSLFSIAKRYGVSYEQLAKINGLPDSSLESPAESHSIDGITHMIIPF